jgi:hypothetical protein
MGNPLLLLWSCVLSLSDAGMVGWQARTKSITLPRHLSVRKVPERQIIPKSGYFARNGVILAQPLGRDGTGSF